tara:strand:- start:537 stop:761 length:225 start_codon:yes stop_codon:yes gene_type:complete
MPSYHDTLQVRDMKEILKDNVNNLEHQLTHANSRVASLTEKLGNILAIHRDLEYHLQGIEIYLSDIKELIGKGE